jgi:macrodomain Ter protein organizer (MatP/YcbG family)
MRKTIIKQIDIDPKVWRQAKDLANDRGWKLSRYVEDCIHLRTENLTEQEKRGEK